MLSGFTLFVGFCVPLLPEWVFAARLPKDHCWVFDPRQHQIWLVPELHPKDHSYTSFPADHATVFALVGMFLFHFIWKSRRWILVALFILFILPRMVAGAHWLTDIAIGAGTIIMAAMSIAMHTPLMQRTMPIFLWIARLKLIQAPLHAVMKLLRLRSHP